MGNSGQVGATSSKRSESQYSSMAAAVATLSEFAMPSMGVATAASAASIASGETPLRPPAKHQARRKYRDELLGANAGRRLFGHYDPSASGFGIGSIGHGNFAPFVVVV